MMVGVCRVANVLDKACGLKRGDKVIVILPRVPQWWALNIACIRTGCFQKRFLYYVFFVFVSLHVTGS
jgi:acyl-coenzyme A synthetase/AMP-(fatty) acid ligase